VKIYHQAILHAGMKQTLQLKFIDRFMRNTTSTPQIYRAMVNDICIFLKKGWGAAVAQRLSG
jgi:hypothetical protein